jgi:hypothetical protein
LEAPQPARRTVLRAVYLDFLRVVFLVVFFRGDFLVDFLVVFLVERLAAFFAIGSSFNSLTCSFTRRASSTYLSAF